MPKKVQYDMDRCYHAIFDAMIEHNDRVMSLALARFTARLADEPVIRLYVDETKGYGHQANSIRILRILTAPKESADNGFGYSNTVEICYKGHDTGSIRIGSHLTLAKMLENSPRLRALKSSALKNSEDTLTKIKTLLPELSTGRLNDATLKLVELCGEPPDCEATFGFTGGADGSPNSDRQPDFTELLNVRYFLRLQPYLWGIESHQLQQKGHPTIALHGERALGKDRFAQLAIRQAAPELSQEIWDEYLDSQDTALRRRVQILKWLTEAATKGAIDLSFVYGVRYPESAPLKGEYPEDALITVIASILHWQWDDNGKIFSHAKPAVIVNLDTLVWDDRVNLKLLENILSGGSTREELDHRFRGTLTERIVNAGTNRAEYFEYLRAPERTRLQDGGTLDQLKKIYDEWLGVSKDRVLFLQLGSVPPRIFDYVYAKATLPRVFEGQASANLALNVGQWYFHVGRPGVYRKIRYPTANLGLHNMYPLLHSLQFVANQVRRSLSYHDDGQGWEITSLHNIPVNGPSVIRDFMQGYIQEASPYSVYFEKIRTFYADSKNCMLRQGLAFLQSRLDDESMPDWNAQSNSTLSEIYRHLQEKIESTGRIALVPGLFDRLGEGGAFYANLMARLQSDLIIDAAVVCRNPDKELTTVTLQGTTAATITPAETSHRSEARLEFTQEGGRIAFALTITQNSRFALEGVPWIDILNPTLRLFASGGLTPVTGEIGGTLADLGAPVGFPIPERSGLWMLRSAFDDRPDISAVSSLAGGIDLTGSLPAPFASLASWKITSLEMPYDSDHQRLEYVRIDSNTDENVTLSPNLQLTNLKCAFTVTSLDDSGSGTVEALVSGDLPIGSASVHLFGTPPELLHHRSRPLSGKIAMEDLLAVFLPGVTLRLPSAPSINNVHFRYRLDECAYDMDCNLNIDWPIATHLVIRSLTLSLQNKPAVEGLIAGAITLLSGSDDGIPLWMTGRYLPESRQWFFESQPSDGTVRLSELVREYLGRETEQDDTISDLRLSFLPEENSWRLTGRTTESRFVPACFDQADAAPGFVALGNDGAPFGTIHADIVWRGLALRIVYDLDPNSRAFGIVWNGLRGNIEAEIVDGIPHQRARIDIAEGVPLGDITAKMDCWAIDPASGSGTLWNAHAESSAIVSRVTFDFTAKTLSLTVVANSRDTDREVHIPLKRVPRDAGAATADERRTASPAAR